MCKRCNPKAALEVDGQHKAKHVQIGTAGGHVLAHHVIMSAFPDEIEIRSGVLQRAREEGHDWDEAAFRREAIVGGKGRGEWWVPNHQNNGTVPL